jgi:hypothetical protein
VSFVVNLGLVGRKSKVDSRATEMCKPDGGMTLSHGGFATFAGKPTRAINLCVLARNPRPRQTYNFPQSRVWHHSSSILAPPNPPSHPIFFFVNFVPSWKLRTRGHSISRDRSVAGAINVALE